jgi:hypothetical protein
MKKEATANGSDEEESEEPDLKFKVKIEEAQPEGVKLSKRNTCIISIL